MKYTLSLLVALALSSINAQLDRSIMPKAASPTPIQLKESEVWTTKNGMVVILSEDHKLPKVSFDLILGYNPGLEGAKAGLNELTGSLIMSGTQNRSKDQLDKEIDFIGASLNATASNIYLSTLTKHLEKGMGLMADITLNASFPESEYTRIVDQVKSGLVSLKSEGQAMANNATYKVNFPKHPYGEVMTFKTLEAITLDDIKGYYKQHFTPQGAYLTIVGDITRAEADAYIEKFFGSWSGMTPFQSQFADPNKTDGNQVYFVNKPGAVQSVIQVTFPIPLRMGNPDNLKLSVLNDVFGGGGFGTRLMQNLREDKAFTYGCYSGLNIENKGAWISVSGNFRNDVTDSAITEIVNELNRLLADDIKADELELTKATKNGSFGRSLERPQTIARFAYNIQRYGLPADYYKTYLQQLDAITPAELKAIASKYIKANNYNIIVVGNEAVLEKIKRFDSDGQVTKLDEFGDVKSDKIPSDLTINDLLTKVTLSLTQASSLKAATKTVSKIKSMVQKSTLKSDQIPVALSSTSYYTNKGIQADKMEFNGMIAQKQYFDGKTGYTFNMQTGKQEMSSEELAIASIEQGVIPEMNWMNSSSTFKPEVVGIESENGTPYYVVKIAFGSIGEVYHYYDKSSYLKAKTVKVVNQDGESSTTVIEYADYKAVNGVLLPHKTILNVGPMTLNISLDTTEINGAVDLKDFE
jgi:predicted Zn-dependent peptidase